MRQVTNILFYAFFGALLAGLYVSSDPLSVVAGALLAQLANFVIVPSGVLAFNPTKSSKDLKEERGQKMARMEELIKKSEDETRDFSDDELREWDTLDEDLKKLDANIDRQETFENRQKLLATQQGKKLDSLSDQDKRDIRKFSFLRTMRSLLPGEPILDGLEAEMDQEARNEAKCLGYNITGRGIPHMVLAQTSFRDNTITQPTQPEDGSALVRPQYQSFIDLLKANLVLRNLGATFLTGLVGDQIFPKKTQAATSTWKGEIESLDKSNIKFGTFEMKPHRLGTYVMASRQAMIQATPDLENMLRSDIVESVQVALDLAGIAGTGTLNQPLGVLNYTGTGSAEVGANGGAPTRKMLLELEAAIDISNAAMNNLRWLLHPQLSYALRNIPVVSGSDKFVMESGNELHGYPVFKTTQVPTNLAKGTTTGGLTAAIFGNWSDLIVGQWGGLDILVDPYSTALSGMIRYVVAGFYDIGVRREQSFAIAKDIDPTVA